MLIASHALDALAQQLDAAPGGMRVAEVPVAVEPIALARAGSSVYSTAVYFGVPGGFEIGGLGASWRNSTSGIDRLAELAECVSRAGLPDAVRLVAGFSFKEGGSPGAEWEGYPAAAAVLPEAAVVSDAAGTRLVVSVPDAIPVERVIARLRSLRAPSPPQVPEAAAHVIEAHPSPADYRDAVAEAIAAIRAGSADKIVLARSVLVRGETIVDPFGLVQQLRAGRRDFYAYGWQQGDAVFLGASPELLVGRSGFWVSSHPFAGTAPRGADEATDEVLGRQLMGSAKNRREHTLVIDDIAARLADVTTSLTVPATPSLRRMPNYHHLSTAIDGELREAVSVLDLAGLLHPTPAVGGLPRSEALAFIDKVEPVDRGWYSGGIGWIDPAGDGEIAVALRCALVRGADARLYAGNGIVADSDPEAELAETRLKFRALLNLLAAT